MAEKDSYGRIFGEYVEWPKTFNEYDQHSPNPWRMFGFAPEPRQTQWLASLPHGVGCYMVLADWSEFWNDGVHNNNSFPLYAGHSQTSIRARLDKALYTGDALINKVRPTRLPSVGPPCPSRSVPL